MPIRELLTAAGVMVPAAAAVWWLLFRRPVARDIGRRCGAVVLLPLKGHVEDAEYRIRAAVAWARGAEVYVADCGADRETAEIAARLCGEYPSAHWLECDK